MSNHVDEVEDLSNPEYRARHQHEFGRRLQTTIIDDRARRNHPRPFASIPRSADPKDGYRDISYRLFANAIDRCAWWMKQQLSTSDQLEPLIYVGASDFRYQILAMAAVKTGYVMFFISPRNSLDAQTALIDEAKVSKILVSSGSAISNVIDPILQRRPLQKLVVPELAELLTDDDEVVPYEFVGSFDEYRMKPWVLLHTSGSTSTPKIVPLRHGYVSSFDACWRSMEQSDLINTLGQRRIFIPFPLFHIAGIGVNLACALFVDATVVLPPAEAPITAEVVNDVLQNANVEFANLAPFVLIDMVQNPTYLDSLRKLQVLAYGGGPLPQETGDELTKSVRITSYYGSTEACIVHSLLRPWEHWKYFKFDVEFAGIEFRPIENTDNLYEFVFVRDPKLSLNQAIFITYPDIDEYHTKDLFSKHPTEPDLWKYEGRLDDMIVLNNAEKINPIAMEGTITSCPSVDGALVVGSGRFQTALLVEVKNPPLPGQNEEKEKWLSLIWPYVQMANEQCPAYGKISRELIGFVQPDKPFPRAGKGTIQRTPSLKLYTKEIDDLYSSADTGQNGPAQHVLSNFEDVNETQDFLSHWFLQQSRIGKIDLGQDFFNSGMDSLEVVNLTRHINRTARAVSTKQIYDNPTIKQLALSLTSGQDRQEDKGSDDKEVLATMKQMFHDFKFIAKDRKQYANGTDAIVNTTSKHIILIGSTGSLGPYLLDELLTDHTVARVTCLNRSPDAASRQESKHSTLGLTTDFEKVAFVKANLSEPDLGLKDSDYQGLSQSATHIIYSAWAVNFNQHVSSFKPLLQGIRNVIDLTYACMPRRVRLFFMSSVSVADKLRAEQRDVVVPESPVEDWTLSSLGYGQSKLVAEGLIADASKKYGIDAAICRLCQLGGPVNRRGEWNRAEWIPSMVLSSKTMDMIPASLGPLDMVDWLPIDLVGKICLELLFHQASKGFDNARDIRQDGEHAASSNGVPSGHHEIQVWHVTNPNPTLWSSLLPSMLSHMPSTVKTTDIVQWIDQLERGSDQSLAKDTWNTDQVPSVKLLTLFRQLRDDASKYRDALPVAVFDTEKTVSCSETLAQAPAVNSTWVELWMKQWES